MLFYFIRWELAEKLCSDEINSDEDLHFKNMVYARADNTAEYSWGFPVDKE